MEKLIDWLHGITCPALSVPSLQNDTKLEKNKGSLCPQKCIFFRIFIHFWEHRLPCKGRFNVTCPKQMGSAVCSNNRQSVKFWILSSSFILSEIWQNSKNFGWRKCRKTDSLNALQYQQTLSAPSLQQLFWFNWEGWKLFWFNWEVWGLFCQKFWFNWEAWRPNSIFPFLSLTGNDAQLCEVGDLKIASNALLGFLYFCIFVFLYFCQDISSHRKWRTIVWSPKIAFSRVGLFIPTYSEF